MKIKKDIYASDILNARVWAMLFTFTLLALTLCKECVRETRLMEKQKQQHEEYLIDSIKAHIIFEDTWGKVVVIQNEDL